MENNINHYFDWAATSPQDADILRVALEESIEAYANPSSIHTEGVKARNALEKAREECAQTLNVKADRIFFTSGGTESDHIPLLSLLTKPEKGRIILSAIEHPAIRQQAEMMKKAGFDVVTVNPDNDGFINPDSIAEKITADTLYVTLMAVNNETGCIQDIYKTADKITEASKGKRRPHFHVDCVQAAGKIPLDINYPGIDSAALSAHKICGPRGIGILYLSRTITPFLTGGGQEQNIRSGTENLFGAIAFSKVLKKHFISRNNTEAYERFESQKIITERFIEKILRLKGCSIVPKSRENTAGSDNKFSPWVVQAAFRGIPGAVMVRALDSKGFSISTGSACSAKKQSRPILAAMNAPRDIQDTAVRFSFGPLTTEKAVDELAEAITAIHKDFN